MGSVLGCGTWFSPIEEQLYYIPRERVDQYGDIDVYTSKISEFTPTSTLVGSIRDVKNWIDDSRRRDRFVVLTVFVGTLSFLSSL